MYESHWPVLISAEKTMKTIYNIAAFWWVFRSMYIINIVSTYLTQFSFSLYIKKYNIKGKMQKREKVCICQLSRLLACTVCVQLPLSPPIFLKAEGRGWPYTG